MSIELSLRGVDGSSSSSRTLFSTELGTHDSTVMFPQWWDVKASAQYVRCRKIRINRPCGDLDIIIPAAYDTELDLVYDGDTGFTFKRSKDVGRLGIAYHDSTEILVEYIFPKHSGQRPTKIVHTPIVRCFDSDDVVAFGTYYDEHNPQMDAGDLSASWGHYDLNLGDREFDLNL